MVAVTWALEADFDKNGTYEEVLTGRLTPGMTSPQLRRGLSRGGMYTTSEISFGLRNDDNRFTCDNPSSPLAGPVEQGVPVRVRATHNAITYDRWTGFLAKPRWTWARGRLAFLTCQARDISEYFGRYDAVNIVSSTTRRTDQAIGLVLDAMGVAAGLRTLDTGQHTMPFHFVRSQQAMGAIMDAVYAEQGGLLWVTKAGKVRFESRASRLGLTVDHTWGDGTNIKPEEIHYAPDEEDLIATVQLQATIFQADQLQQEVFRFQRGAHNNPADSLFLAAGTIYEAEFHFDAPVLALADPVASEDYLANAAADGSGADRTSSLNPTVTDLGGGGRIRLAPTADLYVTAFRLLATVETFLSDRPIFVAAKSIPGQPSDASYSAQVPFADDTGLLLRDYAMQLLRTHRYPVPPLTLIFSLERNDDVALSLLTAELGDLVKFTNAAAVIDDWWYIESITDTLGVGQITKVEVTLLPTYGYRNLAKIAYDLFTRSNGALGTSLSGDTWLNATDYSIASNKAQAAATGKRRAWVELSATDCVVEATIEGLDGGGGSESLGVVYRLADADNYWVVTCYDLTGTVYLIKRVAGVETTVGSKAGYTFGASHEIRVIVQGNRHRVWFDRKLIIDATDAALNANTKVGLFADSVTAGRVHEDFYAQGLVV